MINSNVLINFLGTNGCEEIATDKHGNKTTVLVEFSEICKDASKYICMLSEFYTAQGVKRELSADECIARQEKMELKLHFLVKKALWLNNRCKSMTGEPFLERKLNGNSARDCAKFVKELYTVLRNYLEMLDGVDVDEESVA